MVSKSTVMIFATIFGVLGSYIPTLLGDHDLLGGWSILGGMFGGFFGIWLAVWLGKKLS